MIAAPLKRPPAAGGQVLARHFRDHMIAAPLKLRSDHAAHAPASIFPRSYDRGPIEAWFTSARPSRGEGISAII